MKISDKIVHQFIEKKLEISDWQSKLKNNKLELLKEIVSAHGSKVYYQNASWSAVLPSKRKMPTVEEVIYYGINSAGGTCVHLNYFIKLILKHLGYDAFIVGAESPVWDIRRSHMVTIVRLGPDIYLIDLGFGRPFLEPVSLQNLPYIAKAGGFVFEYRFNPENQNYERYFHLGCALRGKFDPDTVGKVGYYFKLEELHFDDFTECFRDVFCGNTSFLDGLFLFRFTRWNSPQDFEYVTCRNVVMIKGSTDSYEETVYNSYEDMLPQVKLIFPNLNWTEMNAAILNYNQARLKKIEAQNQSV